jgi:hypothetical protein
LFGDGHKGPLLTTNSGEGRSGWRIITRNGDAIPE